jgi:ADP-ribosylglycohydrolase
MAVPPPDYEERVYAGVLGKLIGVYLGRPIEGWTHERIEAELGDISYYVHDRLGVPLVVADDDISGTFTFLRALPDSGRGRNVTPADIGRAWLNYLVENRTVLWWGGMGNATEHTAYLRLKNGVPAPESGLAGRNGTVLSEQIGAQIFIDGWAMVAPGDPELAADLAGRAARVSHDGEAVHAARVVAAMEALAFVERRVERLQDAVVRLIPPDSVVFRLISDVRGWHAGDGDWRRSRRRIAERYGYDRFGGNCHVVPNHALIHLAILYGGTDFQQALAIVNGSGWDTDCNSGNVGCLMGIKEGLAGIDAGPDWRGPVADRLLLPTADGGRCVTDAVAEAGRVAGIGRTLAGQAPRPPKGGARFHFDLPGAVQGFRPEPPGGAAVENGDGHSRLGRRSLTLRFGPQVGPGAAARAATPTFLPADAFRSGGYGVAGSPTLYAGQVVRAAFEADAANAGPVRCRVVARHHGADDRLTPVGGPEVELPPGARHETEWPVPDSGGSPIADVGIEVAGPAGGAVHLDFLTWDGPPDVTLGRPAQGGSLWLRAWVQAADRFAPGPAPYAYRIIQNEGAGLAIQGTREWTDYRVEAEVAVRLAASAGIAARVQGLRRYYALLLVPGGRARLVRVFDTPEVLGEAAFPWVPDRPYRLALRAVGRRIRAGIDGRDVFDVTDADGRFLDGGAVALVCEEGCIDVGPVAVRPAGAAAPPAEP